MRTAAAAALSMGRLPRHATAAIRVSGSRAPRQRTTGIWIAAFHSPRVCSSNGVSDRPGIQTHNRPASTRAVYRGNLFGISKTGDEQIVNRLESLNPLRRGRLNGEFVEDKTRVGDRRRSAGGVEAWKAGAQTGKRVDPVRWRLAHSRA